MIQVAFMRWKDQPEDIIAVFPQEPCDAFDASLCQSYMHVGQHGSLKDVCYEQDLEPAEFGTYEDLLAELQSIGYDDLEIVYGSEDLMHRNHFVRYSKIWQMRREMHKIEIGGDTC